ncbi:nucleolar protein 58 isoform X1 [Frankliniella occidentalis]|uniref:Nucleolar protein 58 isoform X1 n=1 Tax=Frankliniella occidentalis TaxID=133901 RepID=A0A6J1SQH1_FRAOC|nr:nucleolar protein 58 isoform X1 [Frankliniella occidentalis]
MLVLFETPAGYAIFKLLDEKKLSQTENLYNDFQTPEAASKVVKLKHFEKFQDTTEALAATTAAVEGKVSKMLKKMLKKQVAAEGVHNELLVADAKLGNAIKDKLSLSCVSNTAVQELMRCIRSQLDGLLAGLPKKEMTAMALGLAHSLSRYKLKFSPDKIDTMIVQAVCLLDDLDKELNNYIMRCREWYGWHFPELGKIVTDNIAFVKTVKLIGTRENTSSTDLSDILPEDVEARVKEAAEISMGTEISDDDIENILHLCDQVIEISSYRTQLYDYLRTRMMAVAPNLTVLLGELVGARLISHSGSLVNLAKAPASTLQILGAEKALFRALKTKKDTPKYGLIYHSTLVGSASTANKGKLSRMLAAKASLCTRLDALGEDSTLELGAEHKVKLESRLRLLEEGNLRRLSGTGKAKSKFEKYQGKSEFKQYPAAADSTLPTKRSHSESEDKKPLVEEIEVPKKKIKLEPGAGPSSLVTEVKSEPEDDDESSKKKKKKKKKSKEQSEEEQEAVEVPDVSDSGKKKKKKKKSVSEDVEDVPMEEEVPEPSSEKKKKKKKKSVSE